MNLAEIRQKYPQYDHVSDENLVNALHEKYYSHVPKEDFYTKIGYEAEDNRPWYKRLGTDVFSGLAKQGHRLINTPHDVVAGFESALKPFAELKQQLPGNELVQPPAFGKLSEMIPHQKEYDYAKMLGQPGEGSLSDKIIQGGLEYLPEIVTGGKVAASIGSTGLKAAIKGIKDYPITSSGLAKKALQHKIEAKEIYSGKYGDLFKKAAEQGITETDPLNKGVERIVSHSMPKYHEALLEYKSN